MMNNIIGYILRGINPSLAPLHNTGVEDLFWTALVELRVSELSKLSVDLQGGGTAGTWLGFRA